MNLRQGDLSLLDDPVAQSLLRSTNPAQLAYIWRDGTPRIIPIWFHWNGEDIVMCTPLRSPKVRVLANNAAVTLSIDNDRWPYKVLQIRGIIKVEVVRGVPPEYATAAARYLGVTQGRAWLQQMECLFSHMARITLKPKWVGLLDHERRFPQAVATAHALMQSRVLV